MRECSDTDYTFAPDVHPGLLVDRQVLDAVCGNHSDIGGRDLFATLSLLTGNHPRLQMPVKLVNGDVIIRARVDLRSIVGIMLMSLKTMQLKKYDSDSG